MSLTESNLNSSRRLFEEFPPHTYEAWKKAAVDLLKGVPFEKALITPTYEGFSLQPIYNAADVADLPHMRDALPGLGSGVRGSRASGYQTGAWKVSQELTSSTPREMNAVVLHELMCGQNELNLWLDGPTRAGLDPDGSEVRAVGVCGVSAATCADWLEMLQGVELSAISVFLRAGAAPEAVAAQFIAAAEKKGADPSKVSGAIECDPLTYLVENGGYPGSLENAFDGMAALTRFAAAKAPGLQTVVVQGHAYHNGGASSVQEMAAVLATGVYYIKELLARGLPLDAILPRVRLALSVGSQYFTEIAKFRAMRLLWSRVLEAFGADPDSRRVHLHARTGLWNKTLRDPYVNALRATTEAFAAVVGGVDSLHVGNFDEVIREPDEFSRRWARNVHHILAEECDMTRVVDPAGGSYAVEWLTDQMARQAWQQFQKIEELGGILAVLQSGELQKQVGGTLECKRQSLYRRKDSLVGTNNYPNVDEKALEPRNIDYGSVLERRKAAMGAVRNERDAAKVDGLLAEVAAASCPVSALVAAAKAGATVAELARTVRKGDRTALTPIPLSRAAAPFEALVSRVAALGKVGTLLQINYGPSRRYRLRADWTSAFFRVAGFKLAADDDFLTVDEAVEAAKASPGRIAVITSDDETYGKVAVELATALKAARPDLHLLLAGAPGESEAAWRKAGIDDFVNVRVNNFTFNQALASQLEG